MEGCQLNSTTAISLDCILWNLDFLDYLLIFTTHSFFIHALCSL
jgi:hypothetical protein